ncbi:hypothetical protein LINGRAHAP2_LOCUS7502 [Linum grandiflorum]
MFATCRDSSQSSSTHNKTAAGT